MRYKIRKCAFCHKLRICDEENIIYLGNKLTCTTEILNICNKCHVEKIDKPFFECLNEYIKRELVDCSEIEFGDKVNELRTD